MSIVLKLQVSQSAKPLRCLGRDVENPDRFPSKEKPLRNAASAFNCSCESDFSPVAFENGGSEIPPLEIICIRIYDLSSSHLEDPLDTFESEFFTEMAIF